MFETTEDTEVHTQWQKIPHTDNSVGEKPVKDVHVRTVLAHCEHQGEFLVMHYTNPLNDNS